MYKSIYYILIPLTMVILSACFAKDVDSKRPVKVELKNNNGKYRIFVDNKPFYVKGAGLEHGDIENLSSHGANSFRTWRTDNGEKSALEVLDEAHKNGLMVLMGIEIGRTRHGYDYNDTVWVKEQYESVKQQVLELKDHPALLAWAIGNELNHHNEDKKVWKAVNEISKMIHEIDGNHPTTTTFAGFNKENADDFKTFCKDVDFVSIQMYGDIINLQKRIKESGYEGPYMVTEWGATGHWEMPATEWGIPIEQTSTEKAKTVKERWEKAIKVDDKNCLGSYIFLWEQKQERTPTWYGLFTENNNEIGVIDVMHEAWTGKLPNNKCPNIEAFMLDDKSAFDNIYLSPGSEHQLSIKGNDPDEDELFMFFEIISDIEEFYGAGGDKEERPESFSKTENLPFKNHYIFKSPAEEGPYRIFIYITDGNKNVATANIPFYVSVKSSEK